MEETVALRFRCTDGSERHVEAAQSDTVELLKTRVRGRKAFKQEIDRGCEVRCFFQGKPLSDNSSVSSLSNSYAGLQSGICILAQLRMKVVDPPSETNYVALPSEEPDPEGSGADFFCGLLFGFLLNVLMLLFVPTTQLMSDQLNKKQKFGILVGIALSVIAVLVNDGK